MKVLLKKEVCGSCEQCTGPTDTTVSHVKCASKKKKKKKKEENVNAQPLAAIQMHTSCLFLLIVIAACSFISLPFSFHFFCNHRIFCIHLLLSFSKQFRDPFWWAFGHWEEKNPQVATLLGKLLGWFDLHLCLLAVAPYWIKLRTILLILLLPVECWEDDRLASCVFVP